MILPKGERELTEVVTELLVYKQELGTPMWNHINVLLEIDKKFQVPGFSSRKPMNFEDFKIDIMNSYALILKDAISADDTQIIFDHVFFILDLVLWHISYSIAPTLKQHFHMQHETIMKSKGIIESLSKKVVDLTKAYNESEAKVIALEKQLEEYRTNLKDLVEGNNIDLALVALSQRSINIIEMTKKSLEREMETFKETIASMMKITEGSKKYIDEFGNPLTQKKEEKETNSDEEDEIIDEPVKDDDTELLA